MGSTFEARFDSQGHLAIPAELRERHGFTNGAKVRVEDMKDGILIGPVEPAKKMSAREAIEKAIGFSGEDDKSLEMLLEERRRF